ncbi:MAG: malto-oligosyltrehalose trehalohydrolase [Chloroflexi bacterium]|nr:malto-oligosyltrehalose trehalohydrolase [Chloroflexota bacterium]
MPESLGAALLEDGRCRFLVWAPAAEKVEVHLVGPGERLLPMEKLARGYHRALAGDVPAGSLYFYRLDGERGLPDPASRLQPRGVHGPSQVVDSRFPWEDECWSGLPLQQYIIYELHVGAFTGAGTFEAVIPYLDELKELGVTALELMPVAQFPGGRNWGYDGVLPFAVQNTYGGPDGLKRLVNACHRKGLAVVLDVVYNHLGGEGNYLREFGPYFTARYNTPWGDAINFDGPGSDEVRRYFIENALRWITEFHVDALRLDALHAILDGSPYTFLEELVDSVQAELALSNTQAYLIAESASNDARLVRRRESGGCGLDGVWNDDFHHSLHVLLTGERTGYYRDFGEFRQLAKAFSEGFVYSGEHSEHLQRRQGISSRDVPAYRLVVFSQNHDQVGNRMAGERLSHLIPFDGLKLAAGTTLLSPFVPLLFMGEEYGELAPFPYFVSHSDPGLIKAVRVGRREEFAAFEWQGEPPDPQDEATFHKARLDHSLRGTGQHLVLLEFYRELIRLRKKLPALAHLSKDTLDVRSFEAEQVLFLRRWHLDRQAVMAFNFSSDDVTVSLPVPSGRWHRRLDSGEERWSGKGSAVPAQLDSAGQVILALGSWSFVVFTNGR